MHGHPTLGVKDAKPRLSSRPSPKIGKLSEEYLRVRNAQMRTKNLTAEMVLAERRGELIEKSLAERQAAYLLVALRHAILNTPQTYCRRILGLNDASEASRILREMAFSLLNEIKDLPAKSPIRIGFRPSMVTARTMPGAHPARERLTSSNRENEGQSPSAKQDGDRGEAARPRLESLGATALRTVAPLCFATLNCAALSRAELHCAELCCALPALLGSAPLRCAPAVLAHLLGGRLRALLPKASSRMNLAAAKPTTKSPPNTTSGLRRAYDSRSSRTSAGCFSRR